MARGEYPPSVQKLMDKLGCTEAEALDIIESDKAIDQGGKLFEQTADQKKATKEAKKGDSKPRERKQDPDKAFLLAEFAETAKKCECTRVEITTPARILEFEYHGVRYRLTLSKPTK